MIKKIALMSLACVFALNLSACGLLPQEEEFHMAPVIHAYEQQEYDLIYPERGDMTLTADINCAYIPVRTETLSFPVGGLLFEEDLVKVGDSVEEGQLVAQLELGHLEEDLEACEQRLAEIELELSYVEENRDNALERCRLQMKQSKASDRQKALDKINQQYDVEKQALEDEQYLSNLQKEECEARLAERQLFAGLTGTVTYLYTHQPGDRNTLGTPMIIIADSAMSLFRAETVHWDRFEPGQEVVITIQGAEYEAIVAAEEEVGQPEQEKTEGKRAYVYFMLKTPSLEIKDGAHGTIALVVDTRKDVLMLPEKAVTKAGDQKIVYYLDENGLKAYKPIEVGLEADKMLEVVSGLTENEAVILN